MSPRLPVDNENVKTMKTRLLLLCLGMTVLAVMSSPAHAERPFKTDEPWQVGLYRWETFGGITLGSGSWEGIEDRNQFDFTIGADYGLTEVSEVGASWDVFRINDPGSEGIGDARVHYKHRLGEERADWPAMAVDIGVKLPLASRTHNLGTGKTAFGIALLFGWKSLERWTNSARLGYYQSQGWNESSRVELAISTRYKIDESAELRGEFWIDGNERHGQASRREVSAGAAFRMFPTTTIDLMLTAGLTPSVPDLGVKVGWRTDL